jgi:hypothetical protein
MPYFGRNRGASPDRTTSPSSQRKGNAAMKILQFIALVLGALALAPGIAHVASFLNKIHLNESTYFIVQSVYRGWSLFGIVLMGALIANIALAIAARAHVQAFRLVLANLFCLLAGLAICFAFTFPANVATDNWTAVPVNWAQWRWQWEISHAANTAVSFIGYCALILSVLATRE